MPFLSTFTYAHYKFGYTCLWNAHLSPRSFLEIKLSGFYLTICESVNHEVVPSSATHGLQVFSLPCPRILQARTLEWAAIPFSRGPSPSRDRAQVSCTASRFFTAWAPGKIELVYIFWTQFFSQTCTRQLLSSIEWILF